MCRRVLEPPENDHPKLCWENLYSFTMVRRAFLGDVRWGGAAKVEDRGLRTQERVQVDRRGGSGDVTFLNGLGLLRPTKYS